MSAERQNSDIIQLVRTILGDAYIEFKVQRAGVEDDIVREQSKVTCQAVQSDTGETITLAGKGAGVVDALFNAMMERFAGEYPSLRSIRITSFAVAARLGTGSRDAGTDSQGECNLELANSEGKLFPFNHSSRSVLGAVLCTTLSGMAYFINSERAFTTVYHALQDARERNRQDLVQQFTGQMSVLVRNTSYSEVISKIQEELS